MAPQFKRLIVSLDPSGSAGEDADEVGIIVAGLDQNDHGWIVCDASGKYSPIQWGNLAVQLYHRYQCDRSVAERNYGGDMIEALIRNVDPNVSYSSVVATRGKAVRAEPVSALYEQSRVFHLGSFPQLEDEMCGFTSNFDRATAGYSPNRVDALVWALTELMTTPMSSYGIYEVYRQAAAALPLSPVDSRQAWRQRYDEQNARATPSHPDCQGGTVEYANGPLCLLTRVDSRIAAITEERARFAAIMAERLPTSEEAAQHVAAIDHIIREGRNA